MEAHPTEKGGAPDPDCILAVPGADHLLDRIPPERWGVIVAGAVDEAATALKSAALPTPGTIVPKSHSLVDDYTIAAANLGADPMFCLAIEDSATGIAAALEAGLKVIAVATKHTPEDLAAADMVIPSLYSLHVVGLHPVLVLEVDALPDVGTFVPGANKRR